MTEESRGVERKSRVAAAAGYKQINRKQNRLHWAMELHTHTCTHLVKDSDLKLERRCLNGCFESNEPTRGLLVILSQMLEQNKWLTLCSDAFGEIYQKNVRRHKHSLHILWPSIIWKFWILVPLQYDTKIIPFWHINFKNFIMNFFKIKKLNAKSFELKTAVQEIWKLVTFWALSLTVHPWPL